MGSPSDNRVASTPRARLRLQRERVGEQEGRQRHRALAGRRELWDQLRKPFEPDDVDFEVAAHQLAEGCLSVVTCLGPG